jgi:1-acyl-sn-glycerol-3-phosphate acyltransferase
VQRDLGAAALRRMAADARGRAAQGRDIVIFPEGTRRAPGAPPAYKPGIALLYEALALPCVPVALNSGAFWPRRSLLRRPGTIIVEFLPAIEPGLPRKQFLAVLQERIETASARLIPAFYQAQESEISLEKT